jgi:CDP-glucose 4,6-dehydratase
LVLHLAAQPLVRRSYAEPTATWATHVMGKIHLLEALRRLEAPCTAVLITTDNGYRNKEWLYGNLENDHNVIGCGDWAADRIVPDAMRALGRAEPIGVSLADAFNFVPHLEANQSVRELVEEALRHWPGLWSTRSMQRPPMRPVCSTC